MILRTLIACACLAVSFAAVAAAPGSGVVPKFEHVIPNIPGKSLIAVEVDMPPGAKGIPHHHPHSAFIFAYVLSGTIRSQVEGQPVRNYHAGESWYEDPGAHHVVSDNASATKPAKLLAVFVMDSNDKPLVTPDPKP